MSTSDSLPTLCSGDHLDQPTFHARYEAMPASFRAELIEGVVVLPPKRRTIDHGSLSSLATMWIGYYQAFTLGTQAGKSLTLILGPRSEPQPDLALWLDGECGGQTHNQDGYLAGAPELIVECAPSGESYHLHSKRREYERAGVKEYVVVIIDERRVAWFKLADGRFVDLLPDDAGILHSSTFPGLWLDASALSVDEGAGVLRILEQGLASPEHAAFVAQLQAAKARSASQT